MVRTYKHKLMPPAPEIVALAGRFQTAGGRRVMISEDTAQLVARALVTYADIAAHRREDGDLHHYQIEAWDLEEKHAELIAKCFNSGIAKAAFERALIERPRSVLTLRKGTHLMQRHKPDEAESAR